MPAAIEVLVPLRNPTAVLQRTIDSLIEQTDRSFSVLLSDNHSSRGVEFIEDAAKKLEVSGVPVKVVRPPEEIGRVEHWNWVHRMATADWVKPLFVGDWLEPGYIAAVRAAIAAGPEVDVITCSFSSHHADGSISEARYPGGFRSREQVMADVCADGNCLGGPINVCFRRFAFDLLGGFPPALPVSADFWVILMLALRKGLVTCPEPLANFNYHGSRFSTNFPWTRINGDRELFIILLSASSAANFAEIPVPLGVRNRFFARLLKRQIKARVTASLHRD